MAEVDQLSRTLIEEAKRFLEKATEETAPDGKQAYLHAALVLGFSSFEAHINSIAEDFLVRSELTVIEKSILAEKDYRLQEGQFEINESLKMYRLTERIEFIYRRFSGQPIDRTQPWWSRLKEGLAARNELSHPKQHTEITEELVDRSLQTILEALDAIYSAIYAKPYPLRKRGLTSTMTF